MVHVLFRSFALFAFSSIQFSSVAHSCPTLCDPMNRSTPGLPVHHQLPEFTETHVHRVMPSSHLILCRPLLLLPPIPPSIRVFSNESTLHMRWPKYWSFSYSIILSKEIPGLISFRTSWISLIYCCGSVTQSCPTLCNPMDCSMPGFPVLHHLPEFTQTQRMR